jgi:Skp family chaperone for outer membrane proteins
MFSVKSVLGVALLSAAVLQPVARAQTAAPAPVPLAGPALTPPTIALVDMARVVHESSAGKSIDTQLQAEARKIRDQVTRLEEELRNAENEFKRQRSVIAPEAANEQVQALERKQADANRVVQERKEALSKAQDDAYQVVFDNLRDLAQQLAAERRIGLVLRKEAAVTLADKNMDITDDLIQRLNTKLPSVTVTVAAESGAQAQAQVPAQAPVKAQTKK